MSEEEGVKHKDVWAVIIVGLYCLSLFLVEGGGQYATPEQPETYYIETPFDSLISIIERTKESHLDIRVPSQFHKEEAIHPKAKSLSPKHFYYDETQEAFRSTVNTISNKYFYYDDTNEIVSTEIKGNEMSSSISFVELIDGEDLTSRKKANGNVIPKIDRKRNKKFEKHILAKIEDQKTKTESR